MKQALKQETLMYSRYLESPIYDHLNISKNTGNLPSLFTSIDSSRRAQQLCSWFRFDWTKRLTGNSPNESPTARHLLTFFRTNFRTLLQKQFLGTESCQIRQLCMCNDFKMKPQDFCSVRETRGKRHVVSRCVTCEISVSAKPAWRV